MAFLVKPHNSRVILDGYYKIFYCGQQNPVFAYRDNVHAVGLHRNLNVTWSHTFRAQLENCRVANLY